MASERPSIIQVKNDVIQVALPYLEGAKTTYLTSALAAGGTTLTVKDNSDLANNDYLILGPIGGQQTEIVRITAAVTAGTSLTVSAATFSHGVGAKVTLVRYNQVAIYGSSSASDTSPTIIGSAENLNVKLGYNEIKASTTYSYYYARYYNSQGATYSSYSDSAASTGLSYRSRGEIKREFLSIYNEKIDDLITDDWLNRGLNRWQRELQERRKQWSVLRAGSRNVLANTVEDQQGYTMPTDIQDDDSRDAIISVKIGDQWPLIYVDQERFQGLTSNHIGSTLSAAIALIDVTTTITDTSDFPSSGTIHVQGDSMTYTANSESTGVLSGLSSVTSTHSSGDEVWVTYTTGQPTYYTIDDGKLRIYPIPSSSYASYNIYLDYWKRFVDLSDDSDETLFLHVGNAYKYLHWQSAIRRRLGDDIQQARYKVWKEDLEDKVASDPEFRDIRIQPQNMYHNPY